MIVIVIADIRLVSPGCEIPTSFATVTTGAGYELANAANYYCHWPDRRSAWLPGVGKFGAFVLELCMEFVKYRARYLSAVTCEPFPEMPKKVPKALAPKPEITITIVPKFFSSPIHR